MDTGYGAKVAGLPAGQEKESVEQGEGGGGGLVDACYNDYLGAFSLLLLLKSVGGQIGGLECWSICRSLMWWGEEDQTLRHVLCTVGQQISRMRSPRG